MGFDGKFFQRNFKIFLFSEPVTLFYNSSTRHNNNNNTNKERKSFDESSPRSRDIGVNKEVKTSKVESKRNSHCL